MYIFTYIKDRRTKVEYKFSLEIFISDHDKYIFFVYLNVQALRIFVSTTVGNPVRKLKSELFRNLKGDTGYPNI